MSSAAPAPAGDGRCPCLGADIPDGPRAYSPTNAANIYNEILPTGYGHMCGMHDQGGVSSQRQSILAFYCMSHASIMKLACHPQPIATAGPCPNFSAVAHVQMLCGNSLTNPDWCAGSWCWVDPKNCSLAFFSSSFFAGGNLHYSYAACGSRFGSVQEKTPQSSHTASRDSGAMTIAQTIVEQTTCTTPGLASFFQAT